MINWESKKLNVLLWLANGIALIIAINLLGSVYFFRLDITEENRYTIKKPTKDMLMHLDDKLHIEVFLSGNLNAGFKRLQRAIREMLEEFRILSNNRIHYSFTDPASALSKKAQTEFMRDLMSKGIDPINIIEKNGDSRTEKIVFPGAIISYNGIEKGVMLLKGNRAERSDEVLNQSIEGLEFEIAKAIYPLVNTDRKRIGLLTGHGESDSIEIADFNNALWEQYDVFRVNLAKKTSIKNYDVLIMIKPTIPFSDVDLFKLDQYVMRGGKLLVLADVMNVSMDSIYRDDFYALPYRLALSDLLFKYGLRINTNLIQDKLADPIPVVTGEVGGQPQIQNMPWPFFPIISHYENHIITKNMDASLLRFTSDLDTVKAQGIKKTPLLFSSPMAKKVASPVKVSVADLRNTIKPNSFRSGPFVLGYLLEGRFTSRYKNRILPKEIDTAKLLERGRPGKIIVIADGDIAQNEINKKTGAPMQLGYDPVSGYTFANKDLLLNMVAYLTDEEGLIRARDKELKIRPLNSLMIKNHKTFWQTVNIILPLVFLYLYGVVRLYLRKRKYVRS